MKRLLISLIVILTLSSFATFAEKSENIKASEFITTVMKESYGELPENTSKPYLPYAIKAIEEGIILPGEIENYNSDMERKIAFQILDRIAEKENKVSKYASRLNPATDENSQEYMGKVEFDNLIEEFLIKIGKREKEGRYFTLEEIRDQFATQKELEDFLNYQTFFDERKKYETFDPAERESEEFAERMKIRYENGIKWHEDRNDPIYTYRSLNNGMFKKPLTGGSEERNKTFYDIATVLRYHEAVLYSGSPMKINDYDVLVRNGETTTKLTFATNYLYNFQDRGYFSIMFYEKPQIDEEFGTKYNVTLRVNNLSDFRFDDAMDAEAIKKADYLDDTMPMILREMLKVMYKDRVDEFMEVIIKDYKQMMKNPESTMLKTYRDIGVRKIMDEEFLVTVYGKNAGSRYEMYFEEK